MALPSFYYIRLLDRRLSPSLIMVGKSMWQETKDGPSWKSTRSWVSHMCHHKGLNSAKICDSLDADTSPRVLWDETTSLDNSCKAQKQKTQVSLPRSLTHRNYEINKYMLFCFCFVLFKYKFMVIYNAATESQHNSKPLKWRTFY